MGLSSLRVTTGANILWQEKAAETHCPRPSERKRRRLPKPLRVGHSAIPNKKARLTAGLFNLGLRGSKLIHTAERSWRRAFHRLPHLTDPSALGSSEPTASYLKISEGRQHHGSSPYTAKYPDNVAI